MAVQKIINNTTNSDIALEFVGRTVPALGSLTIPTQEYALWAESESISEVSSLINSGDIVVSDGISNLAANVGIPHIQNIKGVFFNHEDVSLLPGAGVNAPALIPVNSTSVGFNMEIGDKIYGQTRVDGLVGDSVEFQIHYTINNSVANRHIQFELAYFTTNGVNDLKTINVADGIVTMGPQVVESTPWLVRQIVVDIPTSAFQSGENYLFLGITRKDPAPLASPTENPIVLRYCKRYYEVL